MVLIRSSQDSFRKSIRVVLALLAVIIGFVSILVASSPKFSNKASLYMPTSGVANADVPGGDASCTGDCAAACGGDGGCGGCGCDSGCK